MLDNDCEGCNVHPRVFTFVETGCDQTVWFDDTTRPFLVERGHYVFDDGRIVHTYACSACSPGGFESDAPDCIHVFAERIRRGTVVLLDTEQATKIRFDRPTTVESHRRAR
jgi:hypothetical protein